MATKNGKAKTTQKVEVSKAKTQTVKAKPEPTVPLDGDMYVNVGRTEFINAVNLVSAALPSKEYNDAKSGIMLEARNDGDIPMLYLTANSLEVFIRHGIKLNDEIEQGYAIPNGNFLTKFVKNLKSMKSPLEIYYQHGDGKTGDELQLICGESYNATIPHYDPAGFVTPPSVDEIKSHDIISIQAHVIKEALSKVAFACSKDTTIINMTAMLIEQKDDGITIVGTDSKRISYLNFKTKVRAPKSVMIGVKYLHSLNDVINALEIKDSEVLNLYMSDDKLFMIVGRTTVGIQVYAGEHPIQSEGGYGQFIIAEDNCDTIVRMNKEKFLASLSLAVAHNNSNKDPIRMCLKKGGKGLLENTDAGSYKFSTEFDIVQLNSQTDTKGTAIVFDFSPDLLMDALSSIKEKEFKLCVVEIEKNGNVYNANNMIVVRPMNEGNQYEYLHVFSLN